MNSLQIFSILLPSLKEVWTRCRDSSLYGRVQTILQDLILDLLKHGNLRTFRAFTKYHMFRVLDILRVFSHVSHFRASRVFCAFCISDSSHFHTSHILRTFHNPTQFVICTLRYLVGFAFPHISHSRVFCALTCTTTHLPGIHHILFTCPVLILQGPLMHISLCFTYITSYISLHSHYVHLSHYVFILHHPCTFSATYLALRPGNLLSMLTCQHIVGGFYGTSLPSLGQLVRRTYHQKSIDFLFDHCILRVASGYS
jgi:hypothetical protein